MFPSAKTILRLLGFSGQGTEASNTKPSLSEAPATERSGEGIPSSESPTPASDREAPLTGPSREQTPPLDQHIAYIEKLVAKGGPDPSEYNAFDRWLSKVAEERRKRELSKRDLEVLRSAFGEALTRKTLQGFSYVKPHGYAGDFEIIDRIYTRHVTDREHLKNWDLYVQAQSGSKAVRNRKSYFLDLAAKLEKSFPHKETLPILNVASGPARDVFEFFEENGRTCPITFECVDNDQNAISYAKDLCAPYLDYICFEKANALRFHTDRKYQLIWSAGLFDYLGDKVFRFLLRNLLTMLREDGELVVGNFAPNNPSKDYMEIITDWHLYYRDAEELRRLARSCGVAPEDIRIGREEENVNLFLHIKSGDHFIST